MSRRRRRGRRATRRRRRRRRLPPRSRRGRFGRSLMTVVRRRFSLGRRRGGRPRGVEDGVPGRRGGLEGGGLGVPAGDDGEAARECGLPDVENVALEVRMELGPDCPASVVVVRRAGGVVESEDGDRAARGGGEDDDDQARGGRELGLVLERGVADGVPGGLDDSRGKHATLEGRFERALARLERGRDAPPEGRHRVAVAALDVVRRHERILHEDDRPRRAVLAREVVASQRLRTHVLRREPGRRVGHAERCLRAHRLLEPAQRRHVHAVHLVERIDHRPEFVPQHRVRRRHHGAPTLPVLRFEPQQPDHRAVLLQPPTRRPDPGARLGYHRLTALPVQASLAAHLVAASLHPRAKGRPPHHHAPRDPADHPLTIPPGR
mmetsp:Transcript_6313/g.19135  ORF Transcript_6313/g.19135 Transcript_6313/m.19135 type:complete len:379 (-) Transcript_6313:47-1183(-)